MNLQISPGGIILALPFYLIAFYLFRRLWRRLGKTPRYWFLPYLAPLVLVLPFADEFWIAWNFERNCKEAGVTVVRQVEAEGYVNATDITSRKTEFAEPKLYYENPADLARFDAKGYRYIEHLYSDGSVMHIERRSDGVYTSILPRPEARYHYRYADPRQWVPVGYQINRLEMQVVDSQGGEVLGRDVWFERYPGFLEGLWIRFFGSGQIICEGSAPKPPDLRHLLYHYVLIPKKAN